MGQTFSRGLFSQSQGFGMFNAMVKEDVARSGNSNMAMAMITNVVRAEQVYAAVMIWINLLLVWTLYVSSLVTGMALGGTPVTFESLPHVVWGVSNSVALTYALQAIYFDVSMNPRGFEVSTLVAIVFLVLSMTINGVHIAGCILEWINAVSDLSISGFGFLVALTIVVGVMILLQAWIVWRFLVFRRDVLDAWSVGWRPGLRLAPRPMTRTPLPEEEQPPTAPEREEEGEFEEEEGKGEDIESRDVALRISDPVRYAVQKGYGRDGGDGTILLGGSLSYSTHLITDKDD